MSQNRLTTTCERNMIFEKTTTITYNTEGEKAEDQTNLTFGSTVPVGVPHRIDEEGRLIPAKSDDTEPHQSPFPAEPSGISHTYQYDSYGNWIKQTRNDPANSDQASTVHNRKFTYYGLRMLEFRLSKLWLTFGALLDSFVPFLNLLQCVPRAPFFSLARGSCPQKRVACHIESV